MRKKSIYTLLFILMHICYAYTQQIITDNSQQPQQLIQNLVGDNCATTANISSPINGSLNNIISYGTFDKGTSNFPLQNGIVLSTGDVIKAGNTVLNGNLSDGNTNWTTDPDVLNILGIDQTLNATAIEFDFVTVNNFVAFNYLFASDEYQQEYPCDFRDVFAILIKKAGTTDPYINIALVPDTNTEVSTNTIRPNINDFCEAQNENYFQGYNIGSTNFNGHTTVLTASSPVIPDETYHIKFIIADHIDERFDSAVFIEAESFGGTIDLGPDQSVCGNDFTLDANIDNPSASYAWFLDGNQIIGENDSSIQVGQSGTYSVQISIPITGSSCLLEDSVDLEIVPFQIADPINPLSVCDPAPSDGIFDFDFPFLKNDEIFAGLPSTNYTISYHLSENDALNNTDPIEGIYQNTELEEIIFVRIESTDGSCLQIGSFDAIVTSPPNITTLNFFLDICFDFITDPGITELNQFDVVMANSEIDRVVTYYLSESDAINRINAITEFPDFNTQPPFIIGRVEILGASDECFSLAYLNFNYLAPPTLNENRLVLNACTDPLYEAFEGATLFTYDNVPVFFDIEAYFEYIENTLYPGSTVSTLELYGLGNPRTLTLSDTSSFTLRLGIAFENGSCQTEIPLIVHKNLLFNVIGDNNEFYLCDDNSNDGIVDFNLEDISTELKDGYEIDIDFYLTENDLQNGINPLDPTELLMVTNEQTLYISSSYEDCHFDSEITLKINPTLTLSDYTFDYCGYSDSITNTTNIILEPLKENIIDDLGISGIVEFYESIEDAQSQTNVISDNFYNLSNNQDLYIRVTDLFTGCYDVSTLQLNITSVLEASNPEPIIVCDEDQNLIANVNLESVLDGLTNSTGNINFTFHESFDNAVNEFYEFLSISNPSNYLTQSGEFFIRAQVESENCFIVFNFDVLIYADPQLDAISDIINCEANPNNPSDFIFADKDAEIINNQEGMEVLYFETEADAINRENPIDKTIAYQNISNPQTIYVRLENEGENSCHKIAPMQIEVRQSPNYNAPTNIFECEINNNGFATVDLNTKISEIELGSTTNLNVTFHLTPLSAEFEVNALPLNYTTTSNPQLIYTRIENIDTGCYNVETFNINTLKQPQVKFGQSLMGCANNFNTTVEWDLTEIEIIILDGRQFNLNFAYYHTEEDAENNLNPILDPENYINSNGSETLYAEVRNIATGCFIIAPFDLIINFPPPINDFEAYNVCDNSDNSVDLSEIDLIILDDTFNIIVSYHTSEADAEANVNALNTEYTYSNDSETFYARLEYSTTHCYTVYPFQLIVNSIPIAHTPENLVNCDDDFDGLVEFNLSTQNLAILNDQNPNEFTVTYFNSENDAVENLNALDFQYVTFDSEIIFARLENNVTGCFDITQFSVVINPLPIVDIEDQVLCLNNSPLTVSADTGNPLDTYSWSTNSVSSEIEITEIGAYSVTITNQFGCESTSTFNVTESESAIIDVVETIDFSDPNNITVTVNGIGDYLYQLNNLPFQDSNVFVNVPIGYNTITIIDQNGCAQITREVLVIDTPKHMSPNDDGHFDTWHITGVETLPGTVIHIFDRFGKLLTTLTYNTSGWDGTYNGNKMPSGDYWYVADVIKEDKRFKVTGHFALRR